MFETRVDLTTQLAHAGFLLQTALLTLTCAFAARHTFELSVPGLRSDRHGLLLPWLWFAAWLALVAPATSPHQLLGEASFWSSGLSCVGRSLLLTLVPALVICWMLRRGAALEPARAGWFAGLSAATVAMLGTQLICANDEPWHALLWHAGFIVTVALAATLLAQLSDTVDVRARR